MGTFHVKAQREVARKHPLPPRLLPGKGVSSKREAVDSPERRAYNSHTFRPGKPIGAPDSEIPNPHGGGLRQSTQNRRLGQLCSGKPSLKPIPVRVFVLVPTRPGSLSGEWVVLSSRRKSQRWMPHSRCRPMCAILATFWPRLYAHRRCRRKQGSACCVRGDEHRVARRFGGCARRRECRKAPMVAYLADWRPQLGTRLAPRDGLVMLRVGAYGLPKAELCPDSA